jgi:hypothetical protein
MDIATAKKYIEALAWLEAPCGQLDALISELEEDEKQKYKQALGTIFSSHFDMLMPIVNKYPGLDPDGAGSEFYNEMRKKYLPR